MAFDKKRFREWIGRLIYAPLVQEDKRDPIQWLLLRHNKSELNRWSIYREIQEEKLQEIAFDVENAAQIHADGLSGLQQYGLFAYADPHDGSRGTLTFRLEGQVDEGVEPSEPASMEGIVGQMMRHNEAMARMMTQGFGTVMAQQSAINRTLGTTLETVLSKRSEEIMAHEEALSLKHERELAAMSQKSSDQRITQSLDRAWAIAPALINRLNGSKIVPEDLSIGENMLIQLTKGITPEQIDALQKILTQEQQFLLFEMIKKGMEANERAGKATP